METKGFSSKQPLNMSGFPCSSPKKLGSFRIWIAFREIVVQIGFVWHKTFDPIFMYYSYSNNAAELSQY